MLTVSLSFFNKTALKWLTSNCISLAMSSWILWALSVKVEPSRLHRAMMASISVRYLQQDKTKNVLSQRFLDLFHFDYLFVGLYGHASTTPGVTGVFIALFHILSGYNHNLHSVWLKVVQNCEVDLSWLSTFYY